MLEEFAGYLDLETTKIKMPMRLTEKELAAFWQLDVNTLRRMRFIKQTPVYIKVSGKIRYPIEGILQYENRHAFIGTNKSAAPTWGIK